MTERAAIGFLSSDRACIQLLKRCHWLACMQPIPPGPARRASVAGVARARKAGSEAVTWRRIVSARPGLRRACAVPARKAPTNRLTVDRYVGLERRRDEFATRTSSS